MSGFHTLFEARAGSASTRRLVSSSTSRLCAGVVSAQAREEKAVSRFHENY